MTLEEKISTLCSKVLKIALNYAINAHAPSDQFKVRAGQPTYSREKVRSVQSLRFLKSPDQNDAHQMQIIPDPSTNTRQTDLLPVWSLYVAPCQYTYGDETTGNKGTINK